MRNGDEDDNDRFPKNAKGSQFRFTSGSMSLLKSNVACIFVGVVIYHAQNIIPVL